MYIRRKRSHSHGFKRTLERLEREAKEAREAGLVPVPKSPEPSLRVLESYCSEYRHCWSGGLMPAPEDPDGSKQDDLSSEIPEPADDSPAAQAEYVKNLQKRVEKQKECILSLEDTIENCEAIIGQQKNDLQKFRDETRDWPMLYVGYWADRLNSWIIEVRFWAESNAMAGTGLWKEVPSEAKKEIIAFLDGWIIQDDFDKVVSRMSPLIRKYVLQMLARMIVHKDCLELFFTDRFWYLNGMMDESLEDRKDTDTGTSLGVFLNALNDRFLLAEYDLAHHWRSVTLRLLNVTYRGHHQPSRDPTFGRKMADIRDEKAAQYAADRMANPAFASLFEHNPAHAKGRLENLQGLYQKAARLGMLFSQESPTFLWRTLKAGPDKFPEALPKLFFRVSSELSSTYFHKLEYVGSSRLDSQEVIAIVTPLFARTGGWDRFPPKKVIMKAEVIIHDPLGRPGDWGSSDEEAEAAWLELNSGNITRGLRGARKNHAKKEVKPKKAPKRS